MTHGHLDMNAKPTETISVREVFGIDTDMTVKGFAESPTGCLPRIPPINSTQTPRWPSLRALATTAA